MEKESFPIRDAKRPVRLRDSGGTPTASALVRKGGETGLSVRVWGARGSVPVSGEEFRRYGGNTPCIEMNCGGHTLLFDAGTGIRPAGLALQREGVTSINLFFTHFHYDHVIGLPFFKPLYDPRIDVAVWSGHMAGIMSTDEMLAELMRKPFFPVAIDICRASLHARDFRSGDVLTPYPGVVVRTGSLNHPGGCIGYRVEYGGRTVALISDTEHVEGVLDPAVLALIEKADLVIYDAAYTDAEMPARRGFGHSTWQQGIRLCKAAGARRLALFHHDPFRDDDALDRIDAEARAAFPEAFACRDGAAFAFAAKEHAAS